MCFSGLFFYILLFLLDFFHIAPEGRAADAQLTGSGGAISAVGGDPDIVNILEDTSHESARVLMTADGLVIC